MEIEDGERKRRLMAVDGVRVDASMHINFMVRYEFSSGRGIYVRWARDDNLRVDSMETDTSNDDASHVRMLPAQHIDAHRSLDVSIIFLRKHYIARATHLSLILIRVVFLNSFNFHVSGDIL